LIKLLEYGGEHLPKEEMAKWLSHVSNNGWSVLALCEKHQKDGETLNTLVSYGEKYLSKEDIAKWLATVRYPYYMAENRIGGSSVGADGYRFPSSIGRMGRGFMRLFPEAGYTLPFRRRLRKSRCLVM